MFCTPDGTLSIENVQGENGSVAWAIEKLTDKFKQNAKKPRNVRLTPKDPVRKEVAKRFEKYDYYRQLELRNQKITLDERQRWIEKKKLERQGITIETEDVGPPMDSVSASTSGI